MCLSCDMACTYCGQDSQEYVCATRHRQDVDGICSVFKLRTQLIDVRLKILVGVLQRSTPCVCFLHHSLRLLCILRLVRNDTRQSIHCCTTAFLSKQPAPQRLIQPSTWDATAETECSLHAYNMHQSLQRRQPTFAAATRADSVSASWAVSVTAVSLTSLIASCARHSAAMASHTQHTCRQSADYAHMHLFAAQACDVYSKHPNAQQKAAATCQRRRQRLVHRRYARLQRGNGGALVLQRRLHTPWASCAVSAVSHDMQCMCDSDFCEKGPFILDEQCTMPLLAKTATHMVTRTLPT